MREEHLATGGGELRSSAASPTPCGLPGPNTRWSPARKAQVVAAVQQGMLSAKEVQERYNLTAEEFESWQQAIDHQGMSGLRMKAIEERRKAPRRSVQVPGEVLLKGAGGVPCTIVDISALGVQLQLSTAVALPRRVELRCSATARSLWIKLAWQRDTLVGASFDRTLAAPWGLEAGLDTWLLGKA